MESSDLGVGVGSVGQAAADRAEQLIGEAAAAEGEVAACEAAGSHDGTPTPHPHPIMVT